MALPEKGEVGRRRVGARDGRGGLTYFLPRQLARVTATRTEGKLEDSIKALAKAQSDVEAAGAAVEAANGAIKQSEDAIIALPAGAPGQAVLSARLTAQRADLASASAAVTVKKAALDAAKASLQTTAASARDAGPGAYKVALKIELLAPTADPAQAFVLRTHHSPLRDDDQKLVVSAAGLLSSTDVTATDRTADVLVEVATFAGAIVSGGGTLVGRDGRSPLPPPDCTRSPGDFTGVVDFADAASVQVLNGYLQCLGVRTIVSGRIWPDDTRPTPARASGDIQGIVYRTPVEIDVRIDKCVDRKGECAADGDVWYPTEAIALSLPQAGPMTFVRQDSGFMTRTKYTLAFKDGILTDYGSSRPSEILEVARTPMRILDGVFDGASKVISLRTGRSNGLAAQSAAEQALLQKRSAAVQERTGLLEAQVKARARREALDRCVSDHVAAATPIDSCVTGD